MNEEDVRKLAALCRIDLNDAEAAELRADMESILKYVSEIGSVVGLNDATVGQTSAHRNVMREDGAPHVSRAYTEDLLAATPERKGGYVKVKSIL